MLSISFIESMRLKTRSVFVPKHKFNIHPEANDLLRSKINPSKGIQHLMIQKTKTTSQHMKGSNKQNKQNKNS